jgi:hypothetical protein
MRVDYIYTRNKKAFRLSSKGFNLNMGLKLQNPNSFMDDLHRAAGLEANCKI